MNSDEYKYTEDAEGTVKFSFDHTRFPALKKHKIAILSGLGVMFLILIIILILRSRPQNILTHNSNIKRQRALPTLSVTPSGSLSEKQSVNDITGREDAEEKTSADSVSDSQNKSGNKNSTKPTTGNSPLKYPARIISPLGNQTDSFSNTGNSGDLGGDNTSAAGNSGNTNTDTNNNTDTDSWNSISDTDYGYSLKYPPEWIPGQAVTTGTQQSISFHLASDPNTTIAIFYISSIPNNNIPFQQSSQSSLQKQFQTKIYIDTEGNAFSYQCVSVLDNQIVETCAVIESTITFI